MTNYLDLIIEIRTIVYYNSILQKIFDSTSLIILTKHFSLILAHPF